MKIIYDKNKREVVTAYSGNISQIRHVKINNKNPQRDYIEVSMEDNMEFLTNLKRYDIYYDDKYKIYKKPKVELIPEKYTIVGDGIDSVRIEIEVTEQYLIPEKLVDWYNFKYIYINNTEYVIENNYIEITSDEPNTVINVELAKGMYYGNPVYIEVV